MERVSRREVMNMSLGSFLSVSASLPLLGQNAKEKNGLLNWNEFIEKVGKEADKHFMDKWDQEAHVKKVADLVQKLNLKDPHITKAKAKYKNRNKNFPEFDKLFYKKPFQISMLHFEKGEYIPHHNHPGMTGVIFVSNGTLLVNNFDIMKEKSDDGQLLLKKVEAAKITAGKLGTLTKDRGNIHDVRATEFTQVIDIFTPPYNKETISKSKWYKLDKKMYKNQKNIFKAKAR